MSKLNILFELIHDFRINSKFWIFWTSIHISQIDFLTDFLGINSFKGGGPNKKKFLSVINSTNHIYMTVC